MELRQLRYFVEIADQGSFTKAAETLAIAQPALTTQVQKLEAEFNAQLFVRTTRGVTLTEVGRVVEQWKGHGEDRGDTYVRRHWYDIVTTSGLAMRVYFDRNPGRSRRPERRWWVFWVEGEEA